MPVSDTLFIVVLVIAIALGLMLVGIMVMLKSKFSPLMMKILTTLHAALFGYETALVEFIGPRGYRTHVYPKIIEILNTLKEEEDIILDVFTATTPHEAMARWISVMESAKIIKDAEVTHDADNDEFTIRIGTCSMCKPIHDIIGDQKGICPLALIISAASSIVDEDREPKISYSTFFPTGTETTLMFQEKTKTPA